MCSSDDRQPPQNPALRNLRQPMPLAEKLKLVVRNISIKITRRQSCCGHPGEPGC